MTARLLDSTIARVPTGLGGQQLEFRFLQDGEREPLLEVFDGMSAHSRHLRFLYPVPRLTESMLRVLTNLEGHGKVALGAFNNGNCLAIARFSRLPDRPEAADLAMAVVDSMQRRGIGRLALTALAGIAADRDISTFAVSVHPDNHASLALLRSFGARLRLIDRIHEGHVAVSAILQRATGNAAPTPSWESRREPSLRPVPLARYCLP